MSSLKKNFSYLFFGQLINNFLPLVLIPFLTSKLNIENYGVYAYTVILIGFLSVLLDFGFNIYGVERIVKARGILKRIKFIHSGVLSAKVIILFFSIILYILLVILNPKFQDHRHEMVFGVLAAIGVSFQQFWIFSGIEKNYLVVVSVLIGKVFLLISVFFFIKSDIDLINLIIFNGLSQILSAAACYWFLRSYNINFSFCLKRGVRFLKKSYPFFISRLAVALYTSAAGVYLGFFASSSSMAIYSIAEQIYKGLQSLINPISQVMYPYMLRTKDFSKFYRLTGFAVIVVSVLSFLSYLIAPYFVKYFFGLEYLKSINVLGVFLFALVLVVPSVLFGYPLLGAKGKLRLANLSVIYAGIAQLLFLMILSVLGWVTPFFVAVTILLAEAYVLFLRFKWGVWDERNSEEKQNR